MFDATLSAAYLKQTSPALEAILTRGTAVPPRFLSSEIGRHTVWVKMRDGTRLASDIYLPPQVPAPVLVTRTPYGRTHRTSMCLTLAQCGYAVISQDCRGTGASEPNTWEYYIYEPEDSVDCVDWIVKQDWCDGFVGGFGGSYAASTQWCMAAHMQMSTIIPEVGGLGVTFETGRLYMYLNAYARSIGKSSDNVAISLPDLERQMLAETLAGGYFNEPLPTANCSQERRRRTWRHFSRAAAVRRVKVLQRIFDTRRFTYIEMERLCTGSGLGVAYGAHSIPSTQPTELIRKIHCPALLVTGWYDWNLKDVLASWTLLSNRFSQTGKPGNRLLITPSSHNATGYREGRETHSELDRTFRTTNMVDLLVRWYAAVKDGMTAGWPPVIYYLMGANEWRVASDWPPANATRVEFYFRERGKLSIQPPTTTEPPDKYNYDPENPTPTVGGSIVSNVYAPGSIDVSDVHRRSDVLTYLTEPLESDIDVVGHLRVVLYVSSTATDTDFSARVSDIFPDGRAIQLQNGMLRTRHRNIADGPTLLHPGQIYRLEIDVWATANRFCRGHRLCVDISSADFPRFDRNTNRGGEVGPPVVATQTIHHDPQHPSHLVASILGSYPEEPSWSNGRP